jgi:carbamoyl-phosphate synthase small subunit
MLPPDRLCIACPCAPPLYPRVASFPVAFQHPLPQSPHFGASEGVDALDIYSSFVKGSLTLEDGTAFEGYSFGAVNSMSGELVFNTGMTGYPEALTDPSYRGQILVLTYPLIGNYGVPGDDKDEHGLPLAFESDNIHVKGLIVSEYSLEHSHWNARRSLAQWLKEHNIPALFGLDTRMLTKMLRDDGAKLAKITFPEESGAHADCAISDPNKRNLVAEVSTKVIRHFNPNGAGPRIVAFDCGIKFNIIRYFINLGVRLALVPYNYDLEQNPDKLEWDGLFISNGPGDPTMAGDCIKSIRWAIDGQDKPIFGICFGNQILALAGKRVSRFVVGCVVVGCVVVGCVVVGCVVVGCVVVAVLRRRFLLLLLLLRRADHHF